MFNQLLLEPNVCKISPDIHFTNNKAKMLQKMFLSTKLNYCLYHVTELRLAVLFFPHLALKLSSHYKGSKKKQSLRKFVYIQPSRRGNSSNLPDQRTQTICIDKKW